MIYLSLLLVSGIMTHRAHNALLRALRVIMVPAEHFDNHEEVPITQEWQLAIWCCGAAHRYGWTFVQLLTHSQALIAIVCWQTACCK